VLGPAQMICRRVLTPEEAPAERYISLGSAGKPSRPIPISEKPQTL
jgi:hypothetical protein